MRLILFIAAVVALLAVPAHAYVGPGLGIGAIGAVLGALFSVLLAILAIFWYPFKRLLKAFRRNSTRKKAVQEEGGQDDES
jgi:amino acid transporter